MPCDLSDFAAVRALVEGCDGIIHYGGISVEQPWEQILPANIQGTYNLYEAARQARVPRIFYPSSNHATGFYPRETRIDVTAPVRPDSLYGVSKCFGEALARYYYDKYGIETAAVRIGSCFPEPKDHRMMVTWLSEDDLVALMERVFLAQRVGYTTLYGVSDNLEKWWDNSQAGFLGWQPRGHRPGGIDQGASADGRPPRLALARERGYSAGSRARQRGMLCGRPPRRRPNPFQHRSFSRNLPPCSPTPAPSRPSPG